MDRACSRYGSNARFWRRNLLRVFRAFSSVLRQTPGYISQRRGTHKTQVVRIKNEMGRACSRYRSNARFWRRNLLRFFRAFSSVVSQTPGYNSQRRDTYQTRVVRIKKNEMGRTCSRYGSNARFWHRNLLRFPRAFSSLLRQTPVYNSQRRDTYKTRVVRIKKNEMDRACSRYRSNARFWHRNLLRVFPVFPLSCKANASV